MSFPDAMVYEKIMGRVMADGVSTAYQVCSDEDSQLIEVVWYKMYDKEKEEDHDNAQISCINKIRTVLYTTINLYGIIQMINRK